jgi:hypothetical protein
MASYDIIERWKFEESDDEDDESRKEVQIVREKDDGGISVRTAYYGPSGRYGQDAPTFPVREEIQQDLFDALEEAFPRAREIRRKEKIEETFNESDFDADELQKLTELAEQAGGVEELEEQLS